MKFALIAAVALIALAQGSFAQDASDLERLSQYFEEMKTKISTDLTEMINNQDLASKAQTFKTQLEPLATQLQEQLKTYSATVEEQIKPLAANVQTQVQPLLENFQAQVEAIFKKVMDQTQAIGN